VGDPIVVLGAGQAGASLVARLRALGYDGPLVLVGEEAVAPYQRPPLSKKYLAGDLEPDRLLIRPHEWYAGQGIDLRLGVRAIELRPGEKTVVLSDSSRLRYFKLALVPGARPRRLPGSLGGDLVGVFTLRSVADADAIRAKLEAGRRLLVIGGGYIGLEAAATAAAKGLEVTVVEVADRILQRVACPKTSDYFRALHAGHGVIIRENTGLQELWGHQGRLEGAVLKDGTRLAADLAVVGVGILPNDDLAKDAGLEVENGIRVDDLCRTSAEDVFAAGDCANFPWRGLRTRLESVQNAVEQAEHAAGAMLGETKPYDPVPWFWSDQFDIKLQIAGLARGYDAAVARPGKRPGSLSHWYFSGEQLVAVDAMNDALAYALGKKILESGRTLPRAAAADADTDLKPWAMG